MGNKKSSRHPVSRTSSAASPAVSGATQIGNKSSVLRAAFSPPEFQLALFASVIQGFDAQRLRIHDINTGRVSREHAVAPKEFINSLDWGYYHGDRPRSEKKRKRKLGIGGTVNGLDCGDAVVAFSTNVSEIRMYSPSEDAIIGTLSGAHDAGIKDFKFSAKRPSMEGWSIGTDNKLVQWDLRAGHSIRIVHLPITSVVTALSRPVPSNPPVICASQTPFIIDVEHQNDSLLSFPAMRDAVHTLLLSSEESIVPGQFLASDDDRYINIFDSQSQRLIMTLVLEKGVSSLSFYYGAKNRRKDRDKIHSSHEDQLLAAVTEDGTIELFSKPFARSSESRASVASIKAKGSQMTRRADARIKIVQPDSRRLVPVVRIDLQGPELVVAWAEGGIKVVFERIRWQVEDSGELAFQGTKEITRTKFSSVLGSAITHGTQDMRQSHVDESKAVYRTGQLAGDINMNEEDAFSSSSSLEQASGEEEPVENKTPKEKRLPGKQRNAADDDVGMLDVSSSGAEEEGEGTGEPSFGELLHANVSETIDVDAELGGEAGPESIVPGNASKAFQIPSGISLSTVLTQALKTNDHAMLESCFHVGDLAIVRTTIQRMDSSLASTLLQKLAERLASRPGRFGHLLVWVQWTCIAHGGAIAGKADVLGRISTLFKVMEMRSSSLTSLLLLKGKLDMLDAQLSLRRSTANRGIENTDSDDEDVIYVEGQEDTDVEAHKPSTITSPSKAIRDTHGMFTEADRDEIVPNGFLSEDSENEGDEGSDDDAEDGENILDIEAEESADSSDAEESLEGDEENEAQDFDEESLGSLADFIAASEDEELSAAEGDPVSEASPPVKKVKLNGKIEGGR